MLNRAKTIAGLAIVIIQLNWSFALACTGPIYSIEHYLGTAELIFEGTIDSVSVLDPEQPFGEKAINLTVKRWWKGGSSQKVTVYSDGSSCGFRGQLKQQWLILAVDPAHPKTDLLTGNVLLILEDGRTVAKLPAQLSKRFGAGSKPANGAAQPAAAPDPTPPSATRGR